MVSKNVSWGSSFFFLLSMVCLLVPAVSFGQVNVKPKNDWNVGIALYSFHRHSLPEALKLAKEAGVKNIEGFSFYNLGPAYGNKSWDNLSADEVVKVKQLIQENGLQMTSVYVGGGQTEQEWKHNFEFGKAYGVKYLVCEPSVEVLPLIDSLAGLYGIKIAIHQHAKGSSYFWHPEVFLKATKGFKNIGACADVGHWVRSGVDPVAAIKSLKGHIIGIHLKDVDADGRDVDFGKGKVGVPALLKELKKQKYTGYIQMECEQNFDDNIKDVKKMLSDFNALTKSK
ncbi:sugar phosphate isomerase/epimerase family protein [Sphingobacterium sp. Mn56C]|uniref:sugar phosphate isomerase/epimerase family protein n=1 Tax=Sphingobacterium sp. Mn56C TaxID=3395261 RepID=UPI003BD341BB